MPTQLDPANPLYSEMRELARRAFDHALAECSIPKAMQRHLELRDDQLRIGHDLYDLHSFATINVISIGKAAHSMAQALTEIVDRGLRGIISCPSAPAAQVFGFRYFIGGHPMPNQDSFRAAEAILKLLGNSCPDTLTIFLISGGASAIAEKPISSAITLDDVIATYKALVYSGAPISEINAVRKHLSAIKGGRMAERLPHRSRFPSWFPTCRRTRSTLWRQVPQCQTPRQSLIVMPSLRSTACFRSFHPACVRSSSGGNCWRLPRRATPRSRTRDTSPSSRTRLL